TTTIARNYLANASPVGLVWRGDFNARHHVPHSGGPVLLITFVLALAAAIAIRNRWIAFLICAALASIVPPAVAVEVGHALRLSALFVILLALSIPALQRWRAAAIAMVILGVLQAAFFFYVFHTTGASRGPEFNAGIQELVDDALDQGQRPVYLDAGPGAIFALWFGELHGAHRSSFALLEPGQTPPPGSIYIGGASPRPDSEVVGVHGIFGVHRIVPRVNAP
ncbi:MAG TPA: hypothetical protein VJZ00_00960, partial [Thermoanaerobaculia bacterium]|nr:hypothetical protein [Thermoanaerobaculia bacterium]